MEEIKVWEIDNNDYITYFESKEDLINYIKRNKSRVFNLLDNGGREDGVITTESASGFIESNKRTIFFDNSHVAFKGNYFSELCISKDFYSENKEELDNVFIDVMFKEEDVTISKYLYNEELVKNLVINANSITFEDGIDVSLEIKEFLNTNGIKTYRTTDFGKTDLSNKKILGNEYETVISNQEKLYINENITDLENLKFIPEHKMIFISSESVGEMNFDNIYNIIKTLRENGQNNDIIISSTFFVDRKGFFESKLINSDFIDVKVGGNTLEELKRENDLLELMVSDIKKSNYSPFEKYIAVYNIVKKFKQYKENDEKGVEARNISRILMNDYMVCVGYAELLKELLYRVGIDSKQHNVSIDLSYDKGFSKEERKIEEDKHARLIVNIKDEKYNINGFYIADPTWDNDLEFDYYNYALISPKKNKEEIRYFFLQNIDFILNCETFDEYAENINLLLDKLENSHKENQKVKSFISVIELILGYIKYLDEKVYKMLMERYGVLTLEKDDYNFELAKEFLTESGHYLVEHYGKDIPLETVIDAACAVNKNVFNFNEEQLEEYKKELLEENIMRDRIYFPYHYKERYIK